MDNIKTDEYYLEKIINDIDFCLEKVKGIDLEDFVKNEILTSAISFKFIQISENSSHFSDHLSRLIEILIFIF